MLHPVLVALLALGLAAQLVCVAGVVLMRGPFDKLHYAGAGSTLGPLLVGAAVVARETVRPHHVLELSSGGADALAAVLLIFLLSPAATIAIARAARRDEYGDLAARPEERLPKDSP